MSAFGEVARAAAAVAVRPVLWTTALRQYGRMVPDRWWATSPRLPVPDPAMLAFRATTQYGDPVHPLERDDLLAWLRWCKAENQRRRVV
ncbi:MAG: hypothetical protein DHS20C19_23280 [Acidimicrobiales bacterium]|nr:MAG: hypothetical protein DHS20C19_23280 [Acidimicrobiales bacterium]